MFAVLCVKAKHTKVKAAIKDNLWIMFVPIPSLRKTFLHLDF